MVERFKNLFWDIFVRWFIFQVFLCFVPLFAVIIYDVIVGYSIEWQEIVTDFMMAVFAVIINTACNCMDYRKFSGRYLRGVFLVVTFISGMLVIFIYFSIVKASVFDANSIRFEIIYRLGLAVIIMHMIIGVVVECISYFQEKNITGGAIERNE